MESNVRNREKMWAGLRRDRVLQLWLLVLLGLTVDHVVPRTPVLASDVWDLVVLVLALLTVRYRLREIESGPERRFWNHISLALAAWFFASLLYYTLYYDTEGSSDIWIGPTVAGSAGEVLIEILFMVDYLFLIFAAEVRPDRAALPFRGSHQKLNRAGVVIFLLGGCVYFSVIPGYYSLEADTRQLTSAGLYFALDLYLIILYWRLSLKQTTGKWHLIYPLLVLSAAAWAVGDFLELLDWSGHLILESRSPVDLLWFLWVPPLVLAARLRHHGPVNEQRTTLTDSDSERISTYWVPLVVCTVLLPFLHIVLNSLELLDSTIERQRSQFVVGYFFLLGLLVFLQQRAQEARSDALELERRRADEAQNRLAQILKSTTDIVVIADRDGRTLFVNRAARKLLGFGEDEDLDSLPFSAYLSEATAERLVREGIPAAVEHGAWSREISFTGRDGREIPTLQVLVAHQGPGGEVEYFSTIARDISERKRAEEALKRAMEAAEAANQAKDEFVATMSHEIRTPMNGVIGMTSLLLDSPLNTKQRGFVETIRGSGETLLAVINDILDFAKIESGKLELERATLELRALIEEALDVVSSAAAERGLDLSYRIEDGVPDHLVGDVTRIRQVLVNLLSNAVKFTERGRVSVSLSGRQLGAGRYRAHFAVSDTGIGIPFERRDRLFVPFSQVDGSSTRQYGGTGLGLAICKRLSELLGGRIWVESTEGEGSTFHFTLLGEAVARPVPTPRKSPGPEVDRARRRRLRVLLAEDNSVNRLIALTMLERLGYRADTVANGLEVLEALDRQAYDVVLMDVRMPEMDGLEATRRVRSRHRGEVRPHIIGFTAGMLAGDRQHCLEAGMDDYLRKPFGIEELRLVLQPATESGQGSDRPLLRGRTPRSS